MYRGTQRGKVIIYIQATISSSVKTTLQCAFKPLKKKTKHPQNVCFFSFFNAYFKKHFHMCCTVPYNFCNIVLKSSQ